MDLSIPGITGPKMITGQTGQYWEYAKSAECSIYLKLNFEPLAWVIDGNQGTIDSLRVNVLYFGPQFDLPAPYLHLDSRPYVIDGEKVGGNLIGKLWVPLGQFNKAMPAMYAAAKLHGIPEVVGSLAPVVAACGAKIVIELSTLFEVMSEGLDKEPVDIKDYTPLVCEQYNMHLQKVRDDVKEIIKAKALKSAGPTE